MYTAQDRREEVLDLLPASARRFLDVGCGKGGFIEAARERLGAEEARGIEPNPESVAVARAGGFDVIEGFFPEALQQLDGQFDCVSFNDVLEHMTDPWHALEAVRDILAPGGSVVVSLPHIGNIEVLHELVRLGDFRYRSYGVLDVTHLRFFTRRSAERMFDEAGFDVAAFQPLAPIVGWKIAGLAKALTKVPGVANKELAYRQLGYRLVIRDR